MSDRPLVTNASNPRQIEKAQKRAAYNEQQRKEDMQKILATAEGRRYLWSLLGRCRVNESVMETSAKIYYNSGQQDIGHSILADIVTARPEAYIQMMEDNNA